MDTLPAAPKSFQALCVSTCGGEECDRHSGHPLSQGWRCFLLLYSLAFLFSLFLTLLSTAWSPTDFLFPSSEVVSITLTLLTQSYVEKMSRLTLSPPPPIHIDRVDIRETVPHLRANPLHWILYETRSFCVSVFMKKLFHSVSSSGYGLNL